MIRKNILFWSLFILVFSLAFASATYYSSRFLTRSDIYWARDYYASNYYAPKIHYQTAYQEPVYHYPSMAIKRNYIYYSPTFNRYQIKECYIIPPRGRIIYTRC